MEECVKERECVCVGERETTTQILSINKIINESREEEEEKRIRTAVYGMWPYCHRTHSGTQT